MSSLSDEEQQAIENMHAMTENGLSALTSMANDALCAYEQGEFANAANIVRVMKAAADLAKYNLDWFAQHGVSSRYLDVDLYRDIVDKYQEPKFDFSKLSGGQYL